MSAPSLHTQLRLLAAAVLAATYAGALFLLTADGPLLRLCGWLFFGGKGLVVVSTLLGLARSPRLALRLWVGRYSFDCLRPRHGWRQALLRFVWELPQGWLGYVMAQGRLLFGQLDRVETLGGVTFAIQQQRHDGRSMGMSLGCMVGIWLSEEVGETFPAHLRLPGGSLFRHEFGHTFDSLRWGWLYLPVVGLPSLLSQLAERLTRGRHRHSHLYAERWADRWASGYFGPLKNA